MIVIRRFVAVPVIGLKYIGDVFMRMPVVFDLLMVIGHDFGNFTGIVGHNAGVGGQDHGRCQHDKRGVFEGGLKTFDHHALSRGLGLLSDVTPLGRTRQ